MGIVGASAISINSYVSMSLSVQVHFQSDFASFNSVLLLTLYFDNGTNRVVYENIYVNALDLSKVAAKIFT
ncbi:MAG: hypothetical protein CMJ19_09780 [Phycisphaeraceae bacterium]|nr:hypothetical protein [Phycisphaeraceae bacterium]